eukprot:11242534-Alexandrium_andersonii.AAC.1
MIPGQRFQGKMPSARVVSEVIPKDDSQKARLKEVWPARARAQPARHCVRHDANRKNKTRW